MRIRLTLRRDPEAPADLAVTVDGMATVADVARELTLADPRRPLGASGDATTLRVEESVLAGGMTGRTLEPDHMLLESGLRQGSTVSVVPVASGFAPAGHAPDRGPAAATLRVVAGPDTGREYSLPVGSSLVGRGSDVDVPINDPMASKRHARITVGETIEIVDLNSSNGLVVDGHTVSRAVLGPSDLVTLGETTVSVVGLGHSAARGQSTPLVPFNRSPRVVPRFPTVRRELPEGPQRPRFQPFPVAMVILPLVMGGVMAVVLQNLLTAVFIVLMPLLAVGMWMETRRQVKVELKEETELFEGRLAEFERQMATLRENERDVRLKEAPSVAETVDSIYRLGPLLWTNAPENPGFLSIRLGLGTAPSRIQVQAPPSGQTLPEFTRRLDDAEREYAMVDAVPVTANLRQGGALGIAGQRGLVEDIARGVMLQIAGLHSPADVTIAAFASHTSKAQWSWLQWLPHVGSPHSPLAGDHLAAGPASGALLLTRLEELLAVRAAAGDSAGSGAAGRRGPVAQEADGFTPPVTPTVVVLVEDDAPVDRGRLTRLAELGPDAGIHVVWVAASVARLPQACRDFLAVDGERGATSGQVRLGRETYPVSCESVDEALAVQLGRMLTPVMDVGRPVDDESDLPRSVSYVTLAGRELVHDDAAVAERWQQSNSVRDTAVPNPKAKGTLRALVGSKGVDQFFLDLKNEGPHALVGGTTGAGKSEFLQAWVMGMAAAYSPDRVTFLFVDYKGGAAFADCVSLPHCVGLVTDLSPHLVRRALASLRAELHYREHLFNRKKAKDLLDMERAADPETPPYLVIVVDEFAALANEVPEFVDGVVDVAARGRSLGLHLILATQRPAGVIKDNLRANTNLRIALRMADEADSDDILGEKTAAYFDPAIPGRGAAKTGPGRVQAFQTGYAGGWTTERPAKPRIDVTEMDFGSAASWEPSGLDSADPGPEGPNDIARMVSTITAAADRAGVALPRKPWLAELADAYDFTRLPNPRTDERLLLGVLDDPAHQAQPTFSYEPDADGNLAIYGTGGSGKSAALRTIAVAAAVTVRGGPVHVYGIDAGSRGLHMLTELPHVGAVVDVDDTERVGRLMRRLRTMVDERSEQYATARAGSISEYRTLAGRPDEPRILLLIDGMSAFRDAYEYSTEGAAVFETLAQLASDGRAVGVHIVMTGERANAIPASIASSVQKRIVLRMTGEDDYLMLGQPRDVLSAQSPPGRAVVGGLEVQLAILGGNANVAVQARETARLAAAMRRQGVIAAPPVRVLPELVPLASLPQPEDGRIVLGVDNASLEPLFVEPSGAFMLAGSPGSGRTTAIVTLASALRTARPGVRRVYFGARRSGLERLGVWDAAYTGEDAVGQAADELALDVGTGEFALFIEGLAEFDSTLAESGITNLATAMVREGLWVVGESETSAWSSAWGLSQPFKNGRRGLLLNPEEHDGDTLLSTSLGRLRGVAPVPGRGFYVARGAARRLQTALAEGELSPSTPSGLAG